MSVWQKAMNLSEKIYRATANYPAIEKYGLADQMRRASVSIASNIAEGYGRGTDMSLFISCPFLKVLLMSWRPKKSYHIVSDM